MLRWIHGEDPAAAQTGPGYCAACGRFALLAPDGACVNSPGCQQRLQPPEPYDGPHACNTGDRLKPGHPEYRRCSCGQWFHSGGGYWYRVQHPPARWLRENGLDPGEFWTVDDDDPGPRFFEDFAVRRPTLLMLLRWLFRG
jgi:hypothetical protein